MRRSPLLVPALLAVLVALLPAAAVRADDPSELVIAFQKQKDPAKIRQHADKLGARLAEILGMPVKTVVPTDYTATVQAMVSQKADVAYVSAIPFLLAKRDAGATLLLAEQRADAAGKLRTDYDSVFVVRKDSSIKSLSDVVNRAADLNMVFTSTTSTSGYIFAYARLVREKLLKPKDDPRKFFKSVSFAGGYTQALQQVVDGRGDVCAVSFYTIEGPKADVYLDKKEREQLRVLARTPGVPTHVIAARAGLSDALKTRIKAALLQVVKEQPDLLADVYGAQSFVEVDEKTHVAGAVEALEFIGIPVEKFMD